MVHLPLTTKQAPFLWPIQSPVTFYFNSLRVAACQSPSLTSSIPLFKSSCDYVRTLFEHSPDILIVSSTFRRASLSLSKLVSFIPKSHSLLILGCGPARLPSHSLCTPRTISSNARHPSIPFPYVSDSNCMINPVSALYLAVAHWRHILDGTIPRSVELSRSFAQQKRSQRQHAQNYGLMHDSVILHFCMSELLALPCGSRNLQHSFPFHYSEKGNTLRDKSPV